MLAAVIATPATAIVAPNPPAPMRRVPHHPASRHPVSRRPSPRASTPTRVARLGIPPAPAAELPENASVERTVGPQGMAWISALDLARLLAATKYWHPDLRKLDLRAGAHRLQLTIDNPFVLVDDRTLELPVAVRSSGGDLKVPVTLIDLLARDSTFTRLIYDAHRGLVLRVPTEGLVRSPVIEAQPNGLRIRFPSEQPEQVAVVSRSRAHFRVRFRGLFVGALPDSLPASRLLRSARAITVFEGSAFEFGIAPEVEGYRVETSSRGDAVDIVLALDAGSGFERFAPEEPSGPPPVHVIVLDPGHGGSDIGVSVGEALEKDLTLTLARDLAHELELRLHARVILTRTDDRDLTVEERAQAANRAHADLVLSLHFDGAPSPAARGVTAYCPPATFGDVPAAEAGPARVEVLPWRDVATRHAVRSRQLAEAVLSALELRGHGPSRLRELLPYPLLGVNAPGLMLECATLTSDTDRARVTGRMGLAELAQAIAAGLDAYRKAE
jgi:N-acetylmuramoyl-L-alanine amidase